ncbi:MAG: NAD-dependent dehydratase [Rhodospirillaceae bacterium]|mgnify:FL=1|nr:NAD-dependent dehydratase [Rhodospirillaceae bacterium]
MMLDGVKVVVVGGAGLIGSHTVDLLLDEDVAEVVVFDNLARGTVENLTGALVDSRCRLVEGDLADPTALGDALEGAAGVFHFAALWLLHCHEHPRDGFDVNLTGTFNLLEACRDQGVQRLVFSSSASVYGDAIEEPMNESHPFNNTTVYGATKIAGEAMATAFCHRDGLGYLGLRYFNVYGPRQDYKGAYVAVIMKMLDRLDRGESPIVFGDGTQAYDFVSVRDCARANIAAMKASVVDRVYNVCTGHQTSIADLAALLIELTGQDVGIDFHPEEVSFVRNRIGDPSRAFGELGFRAETELVDGLRELIEWRRSNLDETVQQ